MIDLSAIKEVVDKFTTADAAIKSAYQKADPILVVRLILDQIAGKKNIYTLDIIIRPGQNTEEIRKRVIGDTGMVPAFYLQGTKMIVSHPLDLELLKRINDVEFVVTIKGSPYSAGGSTDF